MFEALESFFAGLFQWSLIVVTCLALLGIVTTWVRNL